MTAIKEIGEFSIWTENQEFLFRPSFRAMMKIGEPEEIVKTFYDLHSDEITPLIRRAEQAYGEVPAWLLRHISSHSFSKPVLMAAMSVLTACCDSDITLFIGEVVPGKSGRWTFVYRQGALPVFDIVILAQLLITHGIIGKAKVRQLQKNESREAVKGFHAYEYIRAAQNHFGMDKSQAQELSMTEFQLMLSDKYPDQKGYTREEYDSEADKYFERRKRRLAKAA